jgi:TetR/AcrR family transcriptional regulator
MNDKALISGGKVSEGLGAGRRRPSAADRRDRILREAMACFATNGFRGTTTRELAARAGITEAALYRYFPSKEALYGAIVDRKMVAPPILSEGLREDAERGDDRAVLVGLARAILERGQADPAFLRILTFTALEGHALAEPFFAARVRKLREFLADYLARRVAEGAFRPVDPMLASRAFLGMVFDHLNSRVVFQQEEVQAHPLERVADTFASIFLAGVRPQGADHGPA